MMREEVKNNETTLVMHNKYILHDALLNNDVEAD